MLNPARAPAKAVVLCRYMALGLLIRIAMRGAELGKAFLARWQVLRHSKDRGVESVELAIGIALGLVLALVVWAAYEAVVKKYLVQVE